MGFRAVAWASRIPSFTDKVNDKRNSIHVLDLKEVEAIVPAHKVKEFRDSKQTKSTTVVGEKDETKEITSSYYSESSWRKIGDIAKNTTITFSP